jgi:putative addiction module killer protein
VSYISRMIEVRQTAVFAGWMRSLRDKKAAARIAQRIVRIQSGLFGDAKSVGDGVSELRIDHGPGFRVYFVRRGGH